MRFFNKIAFPLHNRIRPKKRVRFSRVFATASRQTDKILCTIIRHGVHHGIGRLLLTNTHFSNLDEKKSTMRFFNKIAFPLHNRIRPKKRVRFSRVFATTRRQTDKILCTIIRHGVHHGIGRLLLKNTHFCFDLLDHHHS